MRKTFAVGKLTSSGAEIQLVEAGASVRWSPPLRRPAPAEAPLTRRPPLLPGLRTVH